MDTSTFSVELNLRYDQTFCSFDRIGCRGHFTQRKTLSSQLLKELKTAMVESDHERKKSIRVGSTSRFDP
jgi:hypothetical protein